MRGATGEFRAVYRRRLLQSLPPIISTIVTESRAAGCDPAAAVRAELQRALTEVMPQLKAGEWGGNPLMARHVPKVAREVVAELLGERGLGP